MASFSGSVVVEVISLFLDISRVNEHREGGQAVGELSETGVWLWLISAALGRGYSVDVSAEINEFNRLSRAPGDPSNPIVDLVID